MEPDSYLHSAVGYDVFKRMAMGDHRSAFAYRRRYGSAPNTAMARLHETYMQTAAAQTAPNSRGGRGQPATARHAEVDVVFDTSFTVGDTAFFGSAETAAILEHVDRSGIMYTQLVGDDVVTSQVLRWVALDPTRLLQLDSATYEHVVVVGPGRPGSGCIQSGGITRGTTQRQGTQFSLGVATSTSFEGHSGHGLGSIQHRQYVLIEAVLRVSGCRLVLAIR